MSVRFEPAHPLIANKEIKRIDAKRQDRKSIDMGMISEKIEQLRFLDEKRMRYVGRERNGDVGFGATF